MPSAYDGWTFLCCDRQNDPSGLPGLQLRVMAEHSQVGAGCLVHEHFLAGGGGPMETSAEVGEEKRELNW